ncbi:MAG: glycosyltransferase family 4 protein [Pseudomonadota bacterium]
MTPDMPSSPAAVATHDAESSDLGTGGRKLRVLFLTQWFDPEPGAIRGLPLAKWLLARGHEVEVITGVPNYPGGKVYDGYRVRPLQREVMDGVPVIRVPLYPSHDQSALKRVANYVSFALSAATIGAAAAKRADICFAVSPPPTLGIPALVLKYLRRIPYVYHVSDMWPDSAVESGMFGDGWVKRVSTSVLHWWCNLLYRQADAVTVLADVPREVLAERGVPKDKIEVVYNWADESLFHPMERDDQLAQELGLSPGDFNLIYAGNFGVFQNLEVAIRAAHQIAERAPKLKLVLIGTGTEEARLKALVAELGATNVSFHGRRPYTDMPAISALSDAMLVHLSDIPLLRWTVPSKTQVALAMGIPMLMAATSDTARLVSESGAGVVCTPDDPDAMAGAMLELAALDRAELHHMGQAGLEFYRRRISLDRGGEIMEGVFANSLQRRAGRRRTA